ncbi:MAG: 4-carboxy-4-hydroxy-2-oxoadipate aldolase/oxaloacetate decarboxylase [Chloroflexota bacterium]
MTDYKQLLNFGTATIHEALGKIGALPSGIKPLNASSRICGPAVTVHTMPRDNLVLHRAIAMAEAGSVIIAHCSGFYEAGYWGDLMGTAAQVRQLEGLVIDGCVRDAAELDEMGFPVFCRGLCIHGTTKFGKGTINEPIAIGDVPIQAGDIVVGDRDGVVIVPKDRIAEAIEMSAEREAKEEEVRNQLKAGKTSLEIYGWQ